MEEPGFGFEEGAVGAGTGRVRGATVGGGRGVTSHNCIDGKPKERRD